jgi:aminopeptidase N
MKILVTFLCLSVITIQGYAQKSLIEKFALKELHSYKQLIYAEKATTANQKMYDVKYYSLDLTPDPSTEILSGRVQIICEVVSTSLDSIELNFWDGMMITDIHLSDLPDKQLLYSHNNDLLAISLDSTFIQGEQIPLTVIYHGSPQNSDYNSFHFDTYNLNPMIWTFSVPYGARAWWPCKDVPSDKADSMDIRVTVPNDLVVASNGSLRETVTQGDVTTYWWHEQYPITTYLVSLAIHPYTVYYDDYLYNDDADTMKLQFYMFPDHYSQYFASNAKIKDMIKCYANIFGEYPFVNEKYGHAEIVPFGYAAMEHQTCTSIDFTYFQTSYWTEWVMTHELAHQWCGNLVTQKTFHHVWLNEGFATYASAFWYECLNDPGAASDYMVVDIENYYGPGTVYVENPNNIDNIYDWDLSYRKGAWVLHMLRHAVSDSIFFEILNSWLSEYRFGTVTTEDFQALCERISALNLQKFFQQWIYSEYYPFYEYSWKSFPDSTGYKTNLLIDQVQQSRVSQTAPLFWMPIDVKITTNSYDTVFVVWDSLESQSFEFFLDSEPTAIELDPDDWILKKSGEITGITRSTESVPGEFTLSQNYPNPFNPSTIIEFTLPKSEFTELTIYNILGKEISTLFSKKLNPGNHTYTFDGKKLASGLYYYQLIAGEYREIKKMIFLR